MEGKYTVYIHTNIINQKKYVGLAKQKPERRWGTNGHGYFKKKKGKYVQPAMVNAILKYGWDSFTHEIIQTGLTKKEAGNLEKQLIEKYQSNKPKYGYNIKDGGFDTFQTVSNHKKIGEARKGYKHSEETKKKIAQSNLGKKQSDESKEKLSASHSHIKEPPKEKIIGPNKYNNIPCRNKDTGECYKSLSEAASNVRSHSTNIRKCIEGKRQRAGGYHWEGITKEEYDEYIAKQNNNS